MKRKKRKRNKGLKGRPSKHHIQPRSRGGSSQLENIVVIDALRHQDYHTLFENRTPEEIVGYLVEYYWKGDWEYVRRAYEAQTDKQQYLNNH